MVRVISFKKNIIWLRENSSYVLKEFWKDLLMDHHYIYKPVFNRSLLSSVGRARDCRVGGPGFDSLAWTNTQVLKITE